MKKIRIKGVEEDIFYEKLDNGLEVYLYTKDTIHSNYVTFTTKYGSVYNEFVPINSDKMTTFPKGIAHFLEHKVFAEKEDPQPMEFFANEVEQSAMPIQHLKIQHIYSMLQSR